MSLERFVLIAVWFLIILIVVLLPREKWREACVVFLACQVFTWSLSLISVEIKWVENPVREFSEAAASNFTFNYAFRPIVCVLYSLNYPRKKNMLMKVFHTFFYVSILTAFIYAVERYTDLIDAIKLTWYISFFLGLIVFYTVEKYKEWFFKEFQNGNEAGIL